MTADRDPVVLLTGATGFLGSAIATALLQRKHVLRCVVRGDRPAGEARMRSALGNTDAAALVTVLPGDLAKPRFGLPPAGFAELTRDVTHIIHCGARVSSVVPYQALHAVNVRSTQQLLDIAATGGAAFCFVSSLAAVSPLSAGEPFELSYPVKGGYAQSKWAADRLVCVAHQEGLVNAVICRPGRVTADSRTGGYNPEDLLEWIIRVCVRLGACPDLSTRVRLSPVDWVSEVIARLAFRPQAYGQAFHVVSGESLSWPEVIAVLEDAGYLLARLPYPSWRAAALDLGKDDTAMALMSQALTENPPSFDRGTGELARVQRLLREDFRALGSPRALLGDTIRAWRGSRVITEPRLVS